MANRKVLEINNEGNELTCWINAKSEIYLQVGEEGIDSSIKGYITLNEEDATALIRELKALIKEM